VAATSQTDPEAHSVKAAATDDVCRTLEEAAAENGLPIEFSGAGRKTHEMAQLHGGYWRRGIRMLRGQIFVEPS
jgi:hypothetical protein